MVYEWDEKRARRARIGRLGATLLLALVVSGLFTAGFAWWA
ncbi:hypothetical protein SAMN03159496_01805 [Rhizobium sp. NFR07]|nr:hypothetical protein SAMN03159496_01805 [Rhizobium sp. NFR07]